MVVNFQVGTDDSVGDRVQAYRISFRDNLKDDINESNGPKLRDLVRPRNLRNKGKNPETEPRYVNSSQDEIVKDVQNTMFHHGPAPLEEHDVKPSGPGAVSIFRSAMMVSSSAFEKVSARWSFSSILMQPNSPQVSGASPHTLWAEDHRS
jgi:hypothetical protein